MISIIIPCYNAEPWLEKTIESVREQSYGYWEIIAVDDGSTDATLSILQKYAHIDKRIRVYSQANKGPSAGRNMALRLVQGHYILFLDSDDLLPHNTLKVLLNTLKQHKADIVEGAIVKFATGLKTKVLIDGPHLNVKDVVLTGRKAAELSLYQRHISSSMSGKLYERKLFTDITFPEGELYEDLSVFYRVALRAKIYVVIDGVTYLYRQRKGSIIHTFGPDRLKVLDVTRRIQEHLSADPKLLAAAHDRRLSAAFNMLGLLLNDTTLPKQRRRACIMQCRAIIKAFSKESSENPNVRLKNRAGAYIARYLPAPALDTLLRLIYK